MKPSLTGFLFFAFFAIDLSSQALKCPAQALIKNFCTCYEPAFYMVCNNLNETFIKQFKLVGLHEINTLVIQNSPNIPFIEDKIEIADFKARSLVIIENEIHKPTNNIESFFSIVTESIEIISHDIKNLDLSKLPDTLTSMSISNVKSLTGFSFVKFSKLTTLELRKVDFATPIDNYVFSQTPIKRLVITGTTTLKGILGFNPGFQCDANTPQIHIDLSQNTGLLNFGFADLFKDKGANCKYFIDFTGNAKMASNFLSSQVTPLVGVKPDQLFLVLHGLKLDCKKCVNDFFKARKDYIHSLQCIVKGANGQPDSVKYLDEYSEAELKAIDKIPC